MRFLALIFSLSLLLPATTAQTVLRNGTFRSLGATASGGGGGSPGDGYEANLYAYYKLDETSGFISADASGAKTLGVFSGSTSAATISGKIGGGFDVADGFALDSSATFGGGGANYNFFGHDFTIRFWIKTTSVGSGDNFILDWDGGTWNVFLGTYPFGGDGKLDFQIEGNSSNFDLVSAPINDGNWHMAIVWFNSGAGVAGIQIDSNSPITQSGVDMFDPGGPSRVRVGGNFGYVLDLDELAFWKDYVLSSSDITFDWNSGAGQTYPLP